MCWAAQSAIWEEYKKEADALDKKLTKVLEDRRAKREELVRAGFLVSDSCGKIACMHVPGCLLSHRVGPP